MMHVHRKNKKTGEKTVDKLFLDVVRIVPNLCTLKCGKMGKKW